MTFGGSFGAVIEYVECVFVKSECNVVTGALLAVEGAGNGCGVYVVHRLLILKFLMVALWFS